jgi:hypothetical protein
VALGAPVTYGSMWRALMDTLSRLWTWQSPAVISRDSMLKATRRHDRERTLRGDPPPQRPPRTTG